jgi:hypothetical protein
MPEFDTRVPHNARVCNSNVVHSVRANRAFLARAVRFLVADMGIRQFLAGLRDPEAILATARDALDSTRPVAVMLVAVLQLIDDADDPAGIVSRLMAACVPGSFLTISHPASDLGTGLDMATRQFNQSGGEKAANRDHAAVARLFGGCDPVDPGVVRVSQWRPDSELEAARHAAVWAGVAQKP